VYGLRLRIQGICRKEYHPATGSPAVISRLAPITSVSSHDPKPYTQNPKLYTQNPKPYTQDPNPYIQDPKPYTQNPKPYTQDPEPRTQIL
jgi:hypothetical protein